MSGVSVEISKRTRLERARAQLTEMLLQELNPAGCWEGELSSSALSTAVATIALRQLDLRSAGGPHQIQLASGLQWLAANANADGGWGDTIRSKSNISTTALCWAAFGACDADAKFRSVVDNAEAWLRHRSGDLGDLPDAIVARYGKDRTFSVPILMTLAIGGRLAPDRWRTIPALPFELAVIPRRFYGTLRLPVVSYALPALIAIGQVIHHHAPSRNPIARFLRNSSRTKTLNLLEELQPANGGFLEATPLTAFVTMALACAGNHEHPVAQKAASFLRQSIRPDGSWPIDTNLATWVTTLSIKALAHQSKVLDPSQQRSIHTWLLQQQTRTIHPYTCAAPGAWAWTDLPGGVPDADDTAGALVALWELNRTDKVTLEAAERGVEWLLDLANRDGGIPTFCPGWGALPFDRSTPEITAHALRAWDCWRPLLSAEHERRIQRATEKALHFLERNQRRDGSFVPLWFGNEFAEEEVNPVYGTAQVLIALHELAQAGTPVSVRVREQAADYLVRAQRKSGGWGGDENAPESLEETAVALEALSESPSGATAVERGTDWLLSQLEAEHWKRPAPIGLYFARLWYYERLYPLIFSVSALGKLCSKHR